MSDIVVRQSGDVRVVVSNGAALEAAADRAEAAANRAEEAAGQGGGRYYFNEDRMRQTRIALRKRALGEGGRFHLGIIQDSLGSASYYTQRLASTLAAQFGDGGGGWTGFGFTGAVGNPNLSINGNARPGTYTVAFSGAGWTSNYHGGSISPDLCHAITSTPGDRITVTCPAAGLAAIKLFVPGPGASGAVQYRYNGGSWSALDISMAPSLVGVHTLGGHPTSGLCTLDIEHVSGTSPLAGLDIQSSAGGCVVHKMHSSGSKAQDWAAAALAGWRSGIGAISMDSVKVMLATNDQAAGRSDAQIATDVAAVMAAVLGEHAGADPWIGVPPENQCGYATPMQDIASEQAALARSQRYGFVDYQTLFGRASAPAEYGFGGVVPLFLSDLTHWDPATGGVLVADADVRFLTTV